MRSTRSNLCEGAFSIVIGFMALCCFAYCQTRTGAPPPGAPPSPARAIGTIQAIAGNELTLGTDKGSPVTVLVQDPSRLVRIAPGEKDLTKAAPVQLSDLKVGDRMMVKGKTSDDGKRMLADSIVVIKEEDLAAKQRHDREDWQKRGVGGVVTAVDTAGGTIAISTATLGGNKEMSVRVSKDTVMRRYAPNSVRFDDATPGTLEQIKKGDQIRARGVLGPDGTEFTAEEIVSGTFRNIAGTVVATDASSNTVTVMDQISKARVTLKIGADSQLRKLPPMIADRIAMRLKGDHPGGQAASATGANHAAGGNSTESPSTRNGPGRSGNAPDFQQMLTHAPTVTLADLQKGDVVMVVATPGTDVTPPTAVTLLTGVEPILAASPNRGQAAMLLSPWNLGGAGGEAGSGANP